MLNPNEVLPSNYRVGKPNPFNGGTSDPELVDGAFPLDEPDWKHSDSFKRPMPEVAFYPHTYPNGKLLKHVATFTTLVLTSLGVYAACSDQSTPTERALTSTPTTIFTSPTPSATPVHFQ